MRASDSSCLTAGIIYKTPTTNTDWNERMHTAVRRAATIRVRVLIYGDFNFLNITFTTGQSSGPDAAEFYNLVLEDNLTGKRNQHIICQERHKSSRLDLVLTNEPFIVDLVGIGILLGSCNDPLSPYV
ncbi:hypothetical protein EG68_00812 [Paragonimus skrjabini miyazakii]|uniref:Endonuclease/exonuclease/phosphatase domain-containing protein n=1 Tax=Paragonimus skrjabini miyazakii TaxID=59628 RepID=A0A8S9Z896_9TREM|nr:hypothetical protein EG68_00812 [Paragonimus skrjabini miyazakii]